MGKVSIFNLGRREGGGGKEGVSLPTALPTNLESERGEYGWKEEGDIQLSL